MFPPDFSESRRYIPSDLELYSDIIQRLTGDSTIIDYILELEEVVEPEILQIGTHAGKNIDFLLKETSRCHVTSIHPKNPSSDQLQYRLQRQLLTQPNRKIQVHQDPINEIIQTQEKKGMYDLLIINNGRLNEPLSLSEILQISKFVLRPSAILLASGIHSGECNTLPQNVIQLYNPWLGKVTIGAINEDFSEI